MREKSKSDFEKDFYKLMNNSVFAKTMENARNSVEIKPGGEEFTLKQYKKINFKDFNIFYDNYIASKIYKMKLKFD